MSTTIEAQRTQNPFKVGDKVRKRKDDNASSLIEGRTYTITRVDRHFVNVNNNNLSAYYHSRFEAADTLRFKRGDRVMVNDVKGIHGEGSAAAYRGKHGVVTEAAPFANGTHAGYYIIKFDDGTKATGGIWSSFVSESVKIAPGTRVRFVKAARYGNGRLFYGDHMGEFATVVEDNPLTAHNEVQVRYIGFGGHDNVAAECLEVAPEVKPAPKAQPKPTRFAKGDRVELWFSHSVKAEATGTVIDPTETSLSPRIGEVMWDVPGWRKDVEVSLLRLAKPKPKAQPVKVRLSDEIIKARVALGKLEKLERLASELGYTLTKSA